MSGHMVGQILEEGDDRGKVIESSTLPAGDGMVIDQVRVRWRKRGTTEYEGARPPGIALLKIAGVTVVGMAANEAIGWCGVKRTGIPMRVFEAVACSRFMQWRGLGLVLRWALYRTTYPEARS